MPRTLMLALSEPLDPSQDDDFNSWYDNKHLHDIVSLPGVVSATRYKLLKGIEFSRARTVGQRYLALYELAGETEQDLAAFAETLQAAMSEGRADVHTTMDLTTIAAAFALPITPTISKSE